MREPNVTRSKKNFNSGIGVTISVLSAIKSTRAGGKKGQVEVGTKRQRKLIR